MAGTENRAPNGGVGRLKLAPHGPEISRLVYGVWRLLDDPAGAAPERVGLKIDACLDLGITTFDHADIYGGYGCEAAFGAVLKERPDLRDKMEIVTKCGIMLTDPARPANRIKHYDYSARHIRESVETSLRNLNTDRIDLLLLHRPSPMLDPDVTAETLKGLISEGKILHAGVSNFTPSQFELLQSRMTDDSILGDSVPGTSEGSVGQGLVTNQVELSPLALEPFLDGSIDTCMRHRIAPMAWSPTGGGRIFTGTDEQSVRVRDCLAKLALKYSTQPDRVLYAWFLAHPSGIVPVLGTNDPDRIRAAAESVDIELELQDWFEIWSASTGEEVP